MTTITPSVTIPQGGASLMIAFRCTRKNILVIGHDEIAASRVLSALEADAKVTLVGPLRLMCDELVYRIQNEQIEWLGEHFEEEQLIGNHLVFVSCSDDIELCQAISHSCCARRIPVNVANQKDLSDFDMTCTYRDQSLQVAVSTNGLSSVNLANRILQTKISSALSPDLGEAVKNVGILRKRVEALDPGSESSVARYQWLSHICEYSSLNRLATLSSSDISELIKTYNTNKKEELFNQFSTSSPITFLVQNDSPAPTANAAQVNKVLEKADVLIVDHDIIPTRREQVTAALSGSSCEIQASPNDMDELNTIGLKALEASKRVVRLLSSINSNNDAEMLFYRSHGYIPLFISGTILNSSSSSSSNIKIDHSVPISV